MHTLKPHLGVYLVTDAGLSGKRGVLEVMEAALLAGVRTVQLREKTSSTRDFVLLARAAMNLCRRHNAMLLINDRVDVALAAGAHGVHVGQDDMPPADARALLGPRAIIGLSVETEEQVRAAEAQPVDYLGLSPVWSTPTKTDTREEWGLSGVARARSLTRLPLVGIGRIGTENAAEVVRAGADGVAVVSAICSAPDPHLASRELIRAVNSAFSERNRRL